jgi:lysophospholipase L1-like esterase
MNPAPGIPRSRRRWLFRFVAVLFGLAPFVVAELLCIVCGWGRPVEHDDPFVGFSAVHPLFVLSEDGQRHEVARSRYKFFAPDSFPAKKGADEFRIFALGGSTVQGRPYSIETSFTTWLELALREADKSRQWDVVNCGGISYASYRLIPILEECLRHEPDLILLCTGHNEFLEDRTYTHIKRVPGVLQSPLQFLAERRLVVLLGEALHGDAASATPRAERPVMADDADAMLNYHNGLAAYHRDDAWHAGVAEHFAYNVRRMVAMCRDAGVPIILIHEPSNLADQPPFKSEHRAGLSAQESQRFAALVGEAQFLYRTDLRGAVARLNEALKIDERHAVVWFELGRCYETLGETNAARAALVRARDEDVCPLRLPSDMEQALRKIAADEDVPLIDSHALLESRTPNGILGNGWLVDHIHPSFDGHQLIAEALVAQLAEEGLVRPREGWEAPARAAYAAHLASLPVVYFARGEEDIENVRHWTRGEAWGPPAEERFPERINR